MRGFSLVEVMVAAAILGFGVLAGARIYTSGVDNTTFNVHHSAASNIATQRLEQLGTQTVDALPQCSGPIGCVREDRILTTPLADDPNGFPCTMIVSSHSPRTADPNGNYRVDTIVEDHGDPRQPGASVVTVSVCWRDKKNVPQQVQLNRLFVPNL